MLHKTAKSICLKGRGEGDVQLLIFLDSPNLVEDRRGKGIVSDAASWVVWALKRMSILEGYYIDYIVKCYSGSNKLFGKKRERLQCIEACAIYRIATLQLFSPKAIIGMGPLCSLALIGREVGATEGTNWIPTESFVGSCVDHVWITYAAGYPLKDPAESVGVFRTLFMAAKEAGLNPEIDKTVQPYDYGF
jgi:uracil-DNA glycosylase family 4